MSFQFPFSPTVPVTTTIKGNWYAQLRRQTAKFDPLRGFVYDYVFEGASQTLMLPIFQDCINAGMACTCTFENDKAILQVTDSTSEYTIDSWEIHANEEVRDLFSHPAIVQAFGDSIGYGQPSIDAFTAIRQAIANDSTVASTLALPALAGISATATTLLKDFYNRYREGATGYRRQQYVLKHKTNVSNRWGVNQADYGIDQIYTPAQMISEASDAGLWVFPLPGRLQFKLAAIPIPVDATFVQNAQFLWGWLKASSTEITDARNRVNIETDYTLELWDTNIYTPYTGPT